MNLSQLMNKRNRDKNDDSMNNIFFPSKFIIKDNKK